MKTALHIVIMDVLAMPITDVKAQIAMHQCSKTATDEQKQHSRNIKHSIILLVLFSVSILQQGIITASTQTPQTELLAVIKKAAI